MHIVNKKCSSNNFLANLKTFFKLIKKVENFQTAFSSPSTVTFKNILTYWFRVVVNECNIMKTEMGVKFLNLLEIANIVITFKFEINHSSLNT